ncbi:A disintegrin and metalloproteinase with thrombospondin motifs 9-like [Haliotis asinina]|uniref:A disintegrin and metalloproteinase with thrombospondin motifs 9-like n=1 Tax=Haliotis asinina TaxID=109174 RepID=UPI0035323627
MEDKPTIASSMALSSDVGVLDCTLQCLRKDLCAGVLYSSTSRMCRYFDHDVTPTTYLGNSAYFGKLRLKAKSCAELQDKFKITTDADYWLYPAMFDGRPVKVYCNNMGSAFPHEYITLPNYNGGFTPGVSNPFCGPTEFPTGFGEGVYQFLKIRVTLTGTMRVVKDDLAFACMVGDLTESYYYGDASDAYAKHEGGVRAPCGPKGNFTIDTAGTGLIIDPDTTWNMFGIDVWKQVNKSTDGTKVDILCGGYAGFCSPNGHLTLVLNPSDVLDWSAAVDPNDVW